MEKLEQDYNIFDWWKKVVLKNYATFDGRARRKEFWSFQLVNFIIIIPLYVLTLVGVLGSESGEPSVMLFIPVGLLMLYGLATFLPSLAVAVRRLHDTDKSGWYLLLSLVPFVSLVLFVFYLLEGNNGKNQYGNDPKNPSNEIQNIGVE